MQHPPLIFLIGFMGCGKTSWGQLLAQKLLLPFIDMDVQIEQHTGQTVSEIFAQSGEEAFRVLEQTALQNTLLSAPAVVATGGGTPCFFDNMDWMNTHGITVFLDTPPDVLASRLKHQKQFRPLLAHVPDHLLGDHITSVLAHRLPFYQKATVSVLQEHDTTHYLNHLLQKIEPLMTASGR
ncbi:MAG: shikimate kinase [Saprospiraceae bacterium]|nr:shikimate kinase [Saprospiraceae bacterium]